MIELKLQPFRTPNFVLTEMRPRSRQLGFESVPKYSLAELDAETLSDLCDQFRAEIFEKAGKDDPRKTVKAARGALNDAEEEEEE